LLALVPDNSKVPLLPNNSKMPPVLDNSKVQQVDRRPSKQHSDM
jgi:hypothetical protein